RHKIISARDELKHGEIVNCEVIGFNEQKHTLEANWFVDIDTDIIFENSIINNIDNETVQKLINLKSEIEVSIRDNIL
ncbi:MAG: hypothetical protein K9H62_19735, partial [Bacteroidales bacterium]|nr:hypothetical protein [Bacteroidales bacterium]